MTFRRGRQAAVLALWVGAIGCRSTPSSREARGPLFGQGGTWTDEQGEVLTLERFRGAPVIVAPFYTSCTQRCPLTISKLHDVDDAFRKSGRVVPIVLVTLDPRIDTSERLHRFKQAHDLPDHWHLLGGSDTDTRRLLRYLGVDAAFDDQHIDHDVRIAIFDSEGRLLRSFSGWAFDVDAAILR